MSEGTSVPEAQSTPRPSAQRLIDRKRVQSTSKGSAASRFGDEPMAEARAGADRVRAVRTTVLQWAVVVWIVLVAVLFAVQYRSSLDEGADIIQERLSIR